jgi:hypothetical protein
MKIPAPLSDCAKEKISDYAVTRKPPSGCKNTLHESPGDLH